MNSNETRTISSSALRPKKGGSRGSSTTPCVWSSEVRTSPPSTPVATRADSDSDGTSTPLSACVRTDAFLTDVYVSAHPFVNAFLLAPRWGGSAYAKSMSCMHASRQNEQAPRRDLGTPRRTPWPKRRRPENHGQTAHIRQREVHTRGETLRHKRPVSVPAVAWVVNRFHRQRRVIRAIRDTADSPWKTANENCQTRGVPSWRRDGLKHDAGRRRLIAVT